MSKAGSWFILYRDRPEITIARAAEVLEGATVRVAEIGEDLLTVTTKGYTFDVALNRGAHVARESRDVADSVGKGRVDQELIAESTARFEIAYEVREGPALFDALVDAQMALTDLCDGIACDIHNGRMMTPDLAFPRSSADFDEETLAEISGLLSPVDSRFDDQLLSVARIGQPFFSWNEIFEVTVAEPAATAHLAHRQGRFTVLTGNLAAFNVMVHADRPSRLTSGLAKRLYLNVASDWTTTNPWPDYVVDRFDEIHFWTPPSDEVRAQIDELRARFADRIEPAQFRETATGAELIVWLIAQRALIRRTLRVDAAGALSRDDEVEARDLPVYEANLWEMVDGRYVPVG